LEWNGAGELITTNHDHAAARDVWSSRG
jgi:hypothetical protein